MAWGDPVSQSDWFDRVTGTNDYERQSWRDNYNGGMAAGDFTGNVNARLEHERDNFQGTTWSGSSTQPSALTLAKIYGAVVGPAAGAVATRPTAEFAGSGPGAAGAVTKPQAAKPQGVNPAKPASGFGGGLMGPLRTVFSDEATQFMVGGYVMKPNPTSSNANEVENRWGDAEFLSPAFFANWGIAGSDVWYNLDANRGGPLHTDNIANAFSGFGSVFSQNYYENAARIQRERPDNAPFWEVTGSARRNSDGGIVYTGGGF